MIKEGANCDQGVKVHKDCGISRIDGVCMCWMICCDGYGIVASSYVDA